MIPYRRTVSDAAGLLSSRIRGRHVPLLVGAAVTSRCDGSCVYCRRAGSGVDDLDTATWLDLLSGMARAGTSRVSFTGGEPLLREDLGRLLNEAHRLGLAVNISTSGRGLVPRLDELAQADGLTVSLDGPRDVMERLRGGGSYDSAVEGVKEARRAGVPVVLHATLTSVNVGRVDAILDEARRLGVRVGLSPLRSVPLGRGGDGSLFPDTHDLRAAVVHLLRLRLRGDRSILNSISCLGHLAHWPDPRRLPCAAGRIYARLESDGRLFACGDRIRDTDGIPATELGFEEAFRRLPPAGCDECWCDTRVEMGLVYGLSPLSMIEAAFR